MARRKIKFGDFLRGSVDSIRNGNGMNPLATQHFVNNAHDNRVAAELGRRAIDGFTNGAIRDWLNEVNSGPRRVQYSSNDVKVSVRSGWSKHFKRPVTDIIVVDKNDREKHLHIIIDEYGTELFRKWNDNHR